MSAKTVNIHGHEIEVISHEEARELLKDAEIVDRYSVFGPHNGCKSQCEGTGWIPVKEDEEDPILKDLWDEAERVKPSDDKWHFILCPTCKGKRKNAN